MPVYLDAPHPAALASVSVVSCNCSRELYEYARAGIDFVADFIERSRKTRQHIEAAPHQLENASHKKAVAL